MISVCIASYNGEKYIKDQLISILTQLSDSDEIIISDDCSTDNTLSVIEGIQDKRIIVVKNKTKAGVMKNLERSLSCAKGEIIFLSDQDDVWLPTKVSKCVEALKKNLLVVTDCKITDSNLNVLNESYFKHRGSGKGIVKNLIKNRYIGCCMAFNKSLLKNAIPFPFKKNLLIHDLWLGIIANSIGNVYFLKEPLVLYRRHGKNASFATEKSKLSIYQKFEYRLIVLLKLIIFIMKR